MHLQDCNGEEKFRERHHFQKKEKSMNLHKGRTIKKSQFLPYKLYFYTENTFEDTCGETVKKTEAITGFSLVKNAKLEKKLFLFLKIHRL